MRAHNTFLHPILVVAGCALGSLAACTSIEEGVPEEGSDVGRVTLPLTSSSSNGDVFILQGATIEIVENGMVVRTLVGNDADLTETSLTAALPIGSYTARLLPGWQVVELEADGTLTPLMAMLRGSDELTFTVTNTATTTLTYLFDVPGGTIVFGGNLEVRFEVRSGFPTLSAKAPGVCASEQDNNGDGLPDSIQTNRYNTQGQLIEVISDWDGDGVADFRSEYGYDSAGNNTSVGSDQDADGDIDTIHTTTYDLAGRMISTRGDADSDLEADYGSDWVYDLDGNLLIEYSYFDLPFEPGSYDARVIYTYDAMGRRLTSEYDANTSMGPADGVPESRSTYAYSGLRVVISGDENGDGVVDRITTQTLDGNGNILETLTDLNADGVADARETQTFDAAGRLLTQEWDSDLDGTPNYRYAVVYDALGNEIRTEVDYDGDGTLEHLVLREYDVHGNLLMTTQDNDADGVPEYVTLTDYSCWQ